MKCDDAQQSQRSLITMLLR